MSPPPVTPVLSLPGWQDSGPGHWQSLWQQRLGHRKVDQSDWLQPRRGDWMARLEDVLRDEPAPVLLVAHSLGCHLVAHWAARTGHAHHVRGALLVAPPDLDHPALPLPLIGWRPTVRTPLPFAAILAYSQDDPFAESPASQRLALHWGATAVALGPLGHVNADSGLGDWPAGLALLDQLARAGDASP